MEEKTKVFLSKAKYDSLNEQLIYMENEGDKKLAALIATSPGSGMGRPLDLPVHDISRQYYAEIDEIRFKLYHATIIDEMIAEYEDKEIVRIGATVTVLGEDETDPENYLILGPDEADPELGKISYLSPLGSSLIDKNEGEEILMKKTGFKFLIEKVEYQKLNLYYEPKDWGKILDRISV